MEAMERKRCSVVDSSWTTFFINWTNQTSGGSLRCFGRPVIWRLQSWSWRISWTPFRPIAAIAPRAGCTLVRRPAALIRLPCSLSEDRHNKIALGVLGRSKDSAAKGQDHNAFARERDLEIDLATVGATGGDQLVIGKVELKYVAGKRRGRRAETGAPRSIPQAA